MRSIVRRIGTGALLTAALLAAGCPAKRDASPSAADAGEKEAPPPHGGIKFAGGGHKYHAELLLDPAAETATVYLLDGNLKNAVPIKSETITLTVRDTPPVSIPLKADPQKDDPKDASSRFRGAHKKLGEKLDPEKVEISAEIGGKQYHFTEDKH